MISTQLLCVCLMQRRVSAGVCDRGGERGKREKEGGEERVHRTSELSKSLQVKRLLDS